MVFLKMERGLLGGETIGPEQRRGIGRHGISQSRDKVSSASLFETGQHNARFTAQAMSEVGPAAFQGRRINPPGRQRDDYQRRHSEEKHAGHSRSGLSLLGFSLAYQTRLEARPKAIKLGSVAGELVELARLLPFDDVQRVLKHAAQISRRNAAHKSG